MILTKEFFKSLSNIAVWAKEYDISIDQVEHDDCGVTSITLVNHEKLRIEEITALHEVMQNFSIYAYHDVLVITNIDEQI